MTPLFAHLLARRVGILDVSQRMRDPPRQPETKGHTMRAIPVPRMTTGAMMVIVGCVALNVAVGASDFNPRAQFILHGSLPTLNLLLVGILALLARDRSRSFLM